MTASARLKQLLFIAAALALVGLGLVAAVSTASPARATDTTPCVPTQDSYTDWVQTDTIVQHDDATPPGTNTELKEYRGPTETKHVTKAATEGTPAQDTRVWWVFRGQNGAAAPAADSLLWKAQPNLPADQSQHSYPGENGLGNPYQPGNNAGNGDWFRFTGTLIPAVEGTPEVSHTDYTWTVWEREFVEGIDCPPPAEECPDGQIGSPPNCETPPAEKKIVVCKYTGTPPGGLSHVIVVSENTLNNVEDAEGNPFTGVFPFEWTDAQGQAGGSIAIGYDDGSEPSLSDCPVPDEVCPEGTTGTPPNCVPDEVCPEGTTGTPPNCVPAEGPDCEADPHAEGCPDDDDEVCPPGTDHAGDEVKHGEDPAKVCDDKDNNPNNPGEPNGPSNHPNPGPTVKGAQATAPTGSPSAPTVAAAPAAARVPNAIDAGLAPSQRDVTDHGGPLGLLGVAGALLGAGLVGASLRPRRRRSLTV